MTEGTKQAWYPASMAINIAEWCESQAKMLGRRASWQFVFILAIVVVGLALLLVLPRLIAQVDIWTTNIFERSPPIEELRDAQTAVEELQQDVAFWHAEHSTLAASLKANADTIESQFDAATALLNRARAMLQTPLAVWHAAELELSGRPRWHTALTAPTGILYVAGSDFVGGPLILRSEDGDGAIWEAAAIEPHPEEGHISDLIGTLDGTMIGVGHIGPVFRRNLATFRSTDGHVWTTTPVENSEGDRISGSLLTAATAANGALFVAGFEDVNIAPVLPGDQPAGFQEVREERRALILRSDDDGAHWQAVSTMDSSGRPLTGIINSLFRSSSGTLLALGWTPGDGGTEPFILRSEDGRDWDLAEHVGEAAATRLGSLLEVAQSRETLFAVGQQGGSPDPIALVLYSDDEGRTWDRVVIEDSDGQLVPGTLSAVALSRDGSIYAGGGLRSGSSSRVLLLRSTAEEIDGQFAFDLIRSESVDGNNLQGFIYDLAETAGGFLLAPGTDLWTIGPYQDGGAITPSIETDQLEGEETEREQLDRVFDVTTVMLEQLTRDGFGYPPTTAQIRTELRQASEAWALASQQHAQTEPLSIRAGESLARQQGIHTNVLEATSLLETALRDADELNRVSQIATRVAVVGLLIYLVQIVVNRYRYLQRMEAFYWARAHSLRLAATAPPGSGGLSGVSVIDLMSALSPDLAAAGKAPAPPSQDVAEILRGVLRRDRKD